MKYSKEVLEPLVKESHSVKQVLEKLGLKGRGGKTHKTIIELIKLYGLDTHHFHRGKYSEEALRKAASDSTSMYEVMRRLGFKFLAGGTHSHLTKKIKELGIDTSHFLGQRSNLGKKLAKPLRPEDRLVLRASGRREKAIILRKCLLKLGIPYQCKVCQLPGSWQGQALVLPIDHINGNPLDNRSENLRFLCPNCHSQTPTFSRNIRDRETNTLPECWNQVDKVPLEGTARKGVGVQLPLRAPVDRRATPKLRPEKRKVDRPPLPVLLRDIEELGFSGTGRRYGVSDNAVRKWIKIYKKYGE